MDVWAIDGDGINGGEEAARCKDGGGTNGGDKATRG